MSLSLQPGVNSSSNLPMQRVALTCANLCLSDIVGKPRIYRMAAADVSTIPTISIQGTDVKREHALKYLGITFDRSMPFECVGTQRPHRRRC